jgi:hypothetical protein
MVSEREAKTGEEFVLKSGSVLARTIRESDALVVLAGSQAAKECAQSLSGGYRAIREQLISSGVVVDSGSCLQFAKNYPFPSPSQAAAVIVGYMVNGRQLWRASDGRSLGEVEEAEAKALGEKLFDQRKPPT